MNDDPSQSAAPRADAVSAPASGDADAGPLAPPSPWKALALGGIVVLCFVAVYATPVGDLVGPLRAGERPPWIHELRARADELGVLGQALFVLGAGALVAVGVPRLALAALGGALFGWIEGTLLAQVGTFLGCWATFAAGRHLGRAWVQDLVARRFRRAGALLGFISRHAFAANVAIRLAPVGNAFATNLLFSVSNVRTGTFLAGTFLGTFPETAVAALLGSTAKGTETQARIVGAVGATLALAVVTGWWTRRLRSRDRRETAAGV
jgi:uncharacterized membrane protein YdjX (TVP38/TMEM64 family)